MLGSLLVGCAVGACGGSPARSATDLSKYRDAANTACAPFTWMKTVGATPPSSRAAARRLITAARIDEQVLERLRKVRVPARVGSDHETLEFLVQRMALLTRHAGEVLRERGWKAWVDVTAEEDSDATFRQMVRTARRLELSACGPDYDDLRRYVRRVVKALDRLGPAVVAAYRRFSRAGGNHIDAGWSHRAVAFLDGVRDTLDLTIGRIEPLRPPPYERRHWRSLLRELQITDGSVDAAAAAFGRARRSTRSIAGSGK